MWLGEQPRCAFQVCNEPSAPRTQEESGLRRRCSLARLLPPRTAAWVQGHSPDPDTLQHVLAGPNWTGWGGAWARPHTFRPP